MFKSVQAARHITIPMNDLVLGSSRSGKHRWIAGNPIIKKAPVSTEAENMVGNQRLVIEVAAHTTTTSSFFLLWHISHDAFGG